MIIMQLKNRKKNLYFMDIEEAAKYLTKADFDNNIIAVFKVTLK